MLKALLEYEDVGDRGARRASAEPLHGRPADELRDECLARAGLYRLLSGAFVEEPGEAFLAALRSAETLRALADAGAHFDADFCEPGQAELAERLACEYTALFAASGGFPPVESVRLTGRFQQQPHFEAGRTYARWGFALRPGRFAVFDDQLGVELMFVAELLERSAAALEAGDPAECRRLEREIKRFWTLHLGRWVRGYGRLIARAAEHSFYREMGRLLAGFADEEIVALGLRIEDLDQGRAEVPKSEIRVEFDADEPECRACASRATSAGASVHPLRDLR